MPYGTCLVRLGASDRWVGASRELSDEEVSRLIEGGHAIEHNVSELSEQSARNFNVAMQRFTAASDASIRRLQESMARSMTPLNQDLDSLFENFTRSFSNFSFTSGGSQPAEAPHPPPAAKKPTPVTKPKATTPKSAIDRLLEDDLIPDDDSGVK